MTYRTKNINSCRCDTSVSIPRPCFRGVRQPMRSVLRRHCCNKRSLCQPFLTPSVLRGKAIAVLTFDTANRAFGSGDSGQVFLDDCRILQIPFARMFWMCRLMFCLVVW